MRLKVESPWVQVTSIEFDALIASYPRQLRIEPALDVKRVRFRKFIDDSLGASPDNEVATWCVSHSTPRIAIRKDIMNWPVGN
jgi:hypothetical protein